MVLSDFTVKVTSRDDAAYLKTLFVKAVDDAAKTLTVRFNGAPSGVYDVQVEGSEGKLQKIELTTLFEVNSISPSAGSTLGGTKLTITGQHFGSVATDNPVKVGDQYCIVLETEETQITCRIEEPEATQSASTELVLVFARTSEEMVCNVLPECQFDYQAPSATVQLISSAFNDATGKIEVTVTGTGLPGVDTNAELFLDGV